MREEQHLPAQEGLDHGSSPEFLTYYEQASLEPATVDRFRLVRDKALALLVSRGRPGSALRVADVGCGAGTQAFLWADRGHDVSGIDVNAPLIAVARRRASERGLRVRFDVGTATALPYPDASMDVCLLPELLEHVPDWKGCLEEAARVLAPGGLLYLSTTNSLCPKQQEFNLPAYSWYPGWLKRRVERLALTSRPSLANYAKYPAVNWFTYYSLRNYLAPRGFECLDRFDMVDLAGAGTLRRLALLLTRKTAPLRCLGHILTEGTVIFAMRRPEAGQS